MLWHDHSADERISEARPRHAGDKRLAAGGKSKRFKLAGGPSLEPFVPVDTAPAIARVEPFSSVSGHEGLGADPGRKTVNIVVAVFEEDIVAARASHQSSAECRLLRGLFSERQFGRQRNLERLSSIDFCRA
jgi:hypothetical protein